MGMTRREAAAAASAASAASRRTAHEDKMIAVLRSRGRLVEHIAASPERAIAEMTARRAVNDMAPTADEMQWIISFLAGNSPRAVYEAVHACTNVYRTSAAEADYAALTPDRGSYPPLPQTMGEAMEQLHRTAQRFPRSLGQKAPAGSAHGAPDFREADYATLAPCRAGCSDPAAHAEGGHDV